MSSATYLLLGQDAAGYNPINTGQIATGITVSLILLGLGIALYYRYGWRRNS